MNKLDEIDTSLCWATLLGGGLDAGEFFAVIH
jgi:hypothetical protein